MKWVLFMFIHITSIAQKSSYEQCAFDYYVNYVHFKECNKKEVYVIKDSINHRSSNFLYGVCFEDYIKVNKPVFIDTILYNTTKISSSIFKISKKLKTKKQTIIWVNQASKSPINTIFVEIVVRNPKKGIHYYIEITANNVPIRWCKKETIF